MPGVVIIIAVLVLFPVLVALGTMLIAAGLGQALWADGEARNELLARLYASDPAQYLDKAVAAQSPILRRNPYKPDAYRLLRKLYTESKRPDPAWCLCQGLVNMNFAEPDEGRIRRKKRSSSGSAALRQKSAWQRQNAESARFDSV